MTTRFDVSEEVYVKATVKEITIRDTGTLYTIVISMPGFKDYQLGNVNENELYSGENMAIDTMTDNVVDNVMAEEGEEW